MTVSNTQTGAKQVTRSDAEGRRVVSGLQPGPVQVRIDAPGFKPSQQEFELSSSRPTRLGTTLEVGQSSETGNAK